MSWAGRGPRWAAQGLGARAPIGAVAMAVIIRGRGSCHEDGPGLALAPESPSPLRLLGSLWPFPPPCSTVGEMGTGWDDLATPLSETAAH